MAEKKIRDDNFYLIGGWMLNRLGLKGVALQIFAIIYGFSQDGEGEFTGSLSYLCEFTGSAKNTVLKALRELTEAGYIIKSDKTTNGVKTCSYRAAPGVQSLNRGGSVSEPVVQNLHRGGSNSAPGGGSVSEHNNKDIDNKEINKEKETTKEKEISAVRRVIELYNGTCRSFPKVTALSEARKKSVRARMETYTLEDFQTLFEKAEASDFLKGKGGKGWKANFDWLISDTYMARVLDGNYDNKEGASRGGDQEDHRGSDTRWGNVGIEL